jgi:hypothetical protein
LEWFVQPIFVQICDGLWCVLQSPTIPKSDGFKPSQQINRPPWITKIMVEHKKTTNEYLVTTMVKQGLNVDFLNICDMLWITTWLKCGFF